MTINTCLKFLINIDSAWKIRCPVVFYGIKGDNRASWPFKR